MLFSRQNIGAVAPRPSSLPFHNRRRSFRTRTETHKKEDNVCTECTKCLECRENDYHGNSKRHADTSIVPKCRVESDADERRCSSSRLLPPSFILLPSSKSRAWSLIKLASVTVFPAVFHLPAHVWIEINILQALAYDAIIRRYPSSVSYFAVANVALGAGVIVVTRYLGTEGIGRTDIGQAVLYMVFYGAWNIAFVRELHGIARGLVHNCVPVFLTLCTSYWIATGDRFDDFWVDGYWLDLFAFGRANAIAVTILIDDYCPAWVVDGEEEV